MRRDWVQTLPKNWKRALGQAVSEGAEEVADLQRQLVPLDDGHLRDSIGTFLTADGTKAYVVAGDTGNDADVAAITRGRSGKARKAFYGVLVEYGTKQRPATPFFWPAWRAKMPSLKRRFARMFAKAFKAGQLKGPVT
jgi:HK97 gp10 family phage protein